jgi:YVTN family beta-propeller protein
MASWLTLLVVALLTAACGSSTVRSAPTPFTSGPLTPSALPSAGTISITIPSVGGQVDPGYIYGIAADDTAVWVHNAEHGTLVRVDPATNHVVATIPVGPGLGNVILQASFVWVIDHGNSAVSNIDPQTNKVIDTFALLPSTGFLGASPGAVWAASQDSGYLFKIDPQTDQVSAPLFPTEAPAWTAFAVGSLWICNVDSEHIGVTRLDPTTKKELAKIDIGRGQGDSCGGIAASQDRVWAALLDGTQTLELGLVQIDPATNQVIATILLPPSSPTSALAADADGVWSATPDLGLFHISSHAHWAASFLSMPHAAGVAVGAGAVRVLKAGDGTLVRITPTA